MIEALLLVILALSVMINRKERLSAVIFCVLNCVFYFAALIVPDHYYYLAAAIFDTGCIAILYMVSPLEKCRLTKILMWLCLISILINFYGFCLFHSYQQPDKYNFLFIVYYAVAAIILAARSINGRDRRWHNRIFNSDTDLLSSHREIRK